MKRLIFVIQIFILVDLVGCAGTRTFHEYAQAGDTVVLAAGWQKTFSRGGITVNITPSDGSPDIIYAPNNPAIRSVINLYPDPISSLMVSDRTSQNITSAATTYAQTIRANFTAQERDWWQTVVFIDLPTSLPLGLTTISVSDGLGHTAQSTLDIIQGSGGSPNTLSAELVGALNRQYLASLERSSYYEVNLSASTLPSAVEVDFTHDPDINTGGVGKAYVVNPVSGVKSLSWNDDGSTLKVIMMPSMAGLVQRAEDFKFYVAGGIKNLATMSVQAYDSAGNSVPGAAVNVVYTAIAIDDVP